MNLALTPKADSDRAARWEYLDQFSRAAADRMSAQVREHLLLIAKHPHIGRPGRVPGTRQFALGRTGLTAFYTVQEDTILILRILHGAQDWPARF